MQYIVLPCTIVRCIGSASHAIYCDRLGIVSVGNGVDAALDNFIDATEVYLQVLKDLGETERILGARQVNIYDSEEGLPTETLLRESSGIKIYLTNWISSFLVLFPLP